MLQEQSFTEAKENIRVLASEINETPEYIVQPGDNIWKIIENKLQAHDVFKGFDEGQRTYLIDELKDKVSAMSPEELKEFGIGSGDPNVIHAGDSLDFSKIMDTESINSSVLDAQNLTDAQVSSIEANDVKIADWAQEHPNAQLDEETINKILNGSEVASEHSAEITDSIIFEKADSLVAQNVESLYGSKGVFGSGFLSTSGERSVDWLDIKTKTVGEVMSKNTFPTEDIWGDDIESVGINSEGIVTKTQEYLKTLIKETGVQPNVGEKVEDYMQRVALHQVSITGDGLKHIDLSNANTGSEVVHNSIPSSESSQNIVTESDGLKTSDVDTPDKFTHENIPNNELVKKITIENIDVQEGNINIEGSLQGYQGTEVLSADYLDKLNMRGDFSLSKAEANSISRDLSLHLAAHDQLVNEGLEEKAGILLKSIQEKVLSYDERLGEGVIDHSKIPGLAKTE